MNDIESLLEMPERPRCLYVLAHGAGAGMRHAFLETTAERLASRRIATFRYEFPYMSAGRRRPDPPRIAEAAVRDTVRTAREKAPGLPIIAGGKSFGGRMTSQAAAAETLDGVGGLVFLGFPLHAPGRVGDARAAHLYDVDLPMLFIQGTRDALADLDLMKKVCKRLGERATLHVVEGGDHSFKVLKSSGRTPSSVMDELADTVSRWVDENL